MASVFGISAGTLAWLADVDRGEVTLPLATDHHARAARVLSRSWRSLTPQQLAGLTAFVEELGVDP